MTDGGHSTQLTHKRVVVIGAGQAGLAMGYSLIRRGLKPQKDFVLIDAATRDALSWNNQWHSLTLITSARHSALPGMPFPGDPDRFPRADEVGVYLSEYADQIGLRPVWGTRALAVAPSPIGRSLTLRTSDGDFETRNVVAATGAFGLPRLPPFAGKAVVPGLNVHSSNYTHPKQVPTGPVLVVGAGNTGRQIARELSYSHDVTLATGSARVELPQRPLGRDISSWLSLTDLPLPRSLRATLARHDVVIGNPMTQLRALGIHDTGRVIGAGDGVFYVEDARPISPTSVIWATGFEPGFGWLPTETKDSNSHVIQKRGVTSIAGLFVLGMPWMRTRKSALLTGVGSDAAHIANLIKQRP